jgi:YHS domain-containing protein
MSENESEKQEKIETRGQDKSTRMLVIMGIVFLVLFLVIYFSIELISGNKTTKKNGKPTAAASSEDVGVSGEFKEGEVQDPICKKVISEESAPYHYDFMGKRFYFCSEECMGKFISDPLTYSGAKVKIKVNLKVPPSPVDTTAPDDVLAPYPSELPEPGGSNNAPSESFEPIDTPADNSGSGETPAAEEPAKEEVKTGKEPAAAPKEPAAAPEEKPAAPPKDSGKTSDAAPPAKAGDKPSLPPGAEGKRPKPAKEENPNLKATPIKPPEKGTESI